LQTEQDPQAKQVSGDSKFQGLSSDSWFADGRQTNPEKSGSKLRNHLLGKSKGWHSEANNFLLDRNPTTK
jgi:hypothetical protein